MTTRRAVCVAVMSVALLAGACGGGGGSTPGPGGCTSPSQCPGSDTTCRIRTCTAGACGTADTSASVACTEGGGQVCDGAGSCVTICALSNPCTSPPTASCSGQDRVTYASPGSCVYSASGPGYTCSYTPTPVDCTAMGLVCQGGACVPPPPSEQLQAIRAAAEACSFGSCAASLAVNGALVTYLRPAIGYEAAGFYLQADPAGPALLVEIDPTTLGTGGGLAVGDRVSLTVDFVSNLDAVLSALSVSGFSREARGVDVAPLVQDLSAAGDVVSALGSYADELVTVQGDLSGAPVTAGTGFVEYGFSTVGYPSGDANLRLVLAAGLPDALDLVAGCSLRAGPAPLGRFNARAEITARRAGEITNLAGCPAPQVGSAVATDTTEVRITLDRRIDPASVASDGSQITFTNGLTAVAATASGRELVVTTSTQTPGASYTATVAGTVADQIGTGLAVGARSASFVGYVVPAVLRLNEAAPYLSSSRDLVELLVVTGGRTGGAKLLGDAVVLAAFPDVTVATGDLVVLHFVPLSAPGDPPGNETTGIAQFPAATYASNYDGAWDFYTGAAGIHFDTAVPATYSSGVLKVVDRLDRIQDAVPFVDPSSQTYGFLDALEAIQAAGLWFPANCGGAPCTTTSTPRASQVSVEWTTTAGVGTTPTGNTVQRKLDQNTRTNADWAIRTSTLGAASAP